MAVTAHYMIRDENNHLKRLRSRLVAFQYVPGSRSGENLGAAMMDVFQELGVVESVSASPRFRLF